ncbi:hypothetical protein D3C73_1347380 [compost metagenome]
MVGTLDRTVHDLALYAGRSPVEDALEPSSAWHEHNDSTPAPVPSHYAAPCLHSE